MKDAGKGSPRGKASGKNWDEIKSNYMREHYPLAQQAAQKIAQGFPDQNIDTDFLTRMLLSQTAHESGWGESGLSKRYHNYGGLKAGSGSKAKVKMATFEGSGDSRVNTNADFMTFRDPAEFYDYYASYLVRRMPMAMQTSDVTDYAKALRQQGYYTDSVQNYARGLKSGYQSVDKLINDLALNKAPSEKMPWFEIADMSITRPVVPTPRADATMVAPVIRYPADKITNENIAVGSRKPSAKPQTSSMVDFLDFMKLFRR